MTAASVVRESVAVADPNAPANVLKPNADGSLNIGSSTGGQASVATASVTRSGNTTTYTANTGWNNGTPTYFSFTGLSGKSKNLFVPQIDIRSSANPTLKLQGILWLFSAIPGTIVSDNANFNIAAADFANLTGGSDGGIPFTLTAPQGSGAANSGVSLTIQNLWALTSSGAAAIYGMAQVVNAYVPANAEVLTISLSWVSIN